MYIMIFEDGSMSLVQTLNKDDLRAADDGYVDLIDISTANEPMRYIDGEWTNIDLTGA